MLGLRSSVSAPRDFFSASISEKNGLGFALLMLSPRILMHFLEPQTKKSLLKTTFFAQIVEKAWGSQFRVYLPGVHDCLPHLRDCLSRLLWLGRRSRGASPETVRLVWAPHFHVYLPGLNVCLPHFRVYLPGFSAGAAAKDHAVGLGSAIPCLPTALVCLPPTLPCLPTGVFARAAAAQGGEFYNPRGLSGTR